MSADDTDSLIRAVAGAPPLPPPAQTSTAIVIHVADPRDLKRINVLLTSFESNIRKLSEAVVVATVRGASDGTDDATRAATVALAVRAALANARVAVVCDHSDSILAARAAALVADWPTDSGVIVDDAIAARLDASFHVEPHSKSNVLVGKRRLLDSNSAAAEPASTTIHPIWLHFDDPALERAFRLQLAQESPKRIRQTARANLLMIVACFVFDYLVGTGWRWLRLYALFVPLNGGLLVFTWLGQKALVRFRLIAVFGYIYGLALVTFWCQARMPGVATPRTLAIWMISSVGTIPRYALRTVHAPLLWPVYVAYALVTCVFAPIADGPVNVFWLVASTLFGLVIAYQLEISQRRLFLERLKTERLQREAHDRDVKTLNDELRRQVADRAARLATALARLDGNPSSTGPRAFASGAVVEERYRVARPIGKGGMGAVYEVERVTDGRRLALKVLTGNPDRTALARFAREAQVAAQLDHPNVISVLDVDVTRSGILFLVMELVAGSSLVAARTKYGDVRWALPILTQVARALSAMHARGIIHRDLKPANVLLDGATVKVADFGLAGLIDNAPLGETLKAVDATSPALTQTGAILGTPLYMAPELAGGAREAAPSSDMFSFGVLAFELLAKDLPYAVPLVLERLRGRSLPEPKLLTHVTPTLRSDLCAMVDGCLAASPGARPTADAVVASLERMTI